MIQLTKVLLAFLLFQALSSVSALETGEIPIHLDTIGYYVEIDLEYRPYTHPDTSKMRLSLSNSGILLNPGCLNFDLFYCVAPKCYTQYGDGPNLKYPDFSVSTKRMNLEIYPNLSSWSHKTTVYLGTNCYTKDSISGLDRIGIIGLGRAGETTRFIPSEIFSIDLKMGYRSRILFREEQSLKASDSKVVLNTDQNWITRLTWGEDSIRFGDVIFYLEGKLIFDLYSDTIGLPLKVYRKLTGAFTEQGVACQDQFIYPTCDMSGWNSSMALPDIYLTVYGQGIKIPPALYIKSMNKGDPIIKLNIRALSYYSDGKNFVDPSFADTIILGTSFMSYYYLVFDQFQDTISLYVKNTTSHASPSTPSSPSSKGSNESNIPNLPIILGIAGIVVLIIIVSLGCFIVFQRRKVAQLKEALQAPVPAPKMNPISVPKMNPNLNFYGNPGMNQSPAPRNYMPPPQ